MRRPLRRPVVEGRELAGFHTTIVRDDSERLVVEGRELAGFHTHSMSCRTISLVVEGRELVATRCSQPLDDLTIAAASDASGLSREELEKAAGSIVSIRVEGAKAATACC